MNQFKTYNTTDYWVRELAGEIPKLDFYLEDHVPNIESDKSEYSIRLTDTLAKKIQGFTNKSPLARFTYFYFLLKILIYKYFGELQTVVSTSCFSSGPMQSCSSPLFLRGSLDEQNDTLKDVLSNCKHIVTCAWQKQDYEYEVVFHKLDLNFKVVSEDLFQVGLVDFSCQKYHSDLKKNLIEICIGENQDEIQLIIKYDYRIRFNFINQFSEHLIHLADHAIDRIHEKVINIEVMSAIDLAKIRKWSEGKHNGKDAVLILDYFKDTVEKFPDKVAIVCQDQAITYSELSFLSTRFSEVLKSTHGVNRQDVVAIRHKTSIAWIISLLAIMKAGGIALPIDSKMPEKRVQTILKDSRPKVVVSNLHDIDFGISMIFPDLNLDEINVNKQLAEQDLDLNLEDPAYIIYTSGSSGTPKGVLLTYLNLWGMITWFQEEFNLNENMVLPQKTSVGFVDSIVEVLLPITLGKSTIYLRPYEQINLNSSDLFQWLGRIRTNILQISPTVFDIIARQVDFSSLKTLKTLILSGEMLSKKKDYDFDVYNVYGCSEASAYSASFSLKELDDGKFPLRNIPIGKPVMGVSLFVLNQHLELLPPYVSGELYIGGQGLTLGYFNDLNLTDVKFIPNPFKANEFLYATGDLVRWLSNGNLQFLGRKDEQIKIRGNRIEVSEIEQTFRLISKIADVIVLPESIKRPQGQHEIILKAFVILNNPISKKSLFTKIAEYLPRYMVPAKIIFIDKIPLNTNGKLDKGALLQLKNQVTRPKDDLSRLEKEILQIWKEVLSIKELSPDENYFNLGGHSMNATQMMLRINKRLKVELTLQEIFNNPTVKAIGRLLENKPNVIREQIPQLQPAEDFELSIGQKSLWLLDRIGDDVLSYNLTSIYKINGEFSVQAFQKAYEVVVRRYEVLRTVIIEIDNEPRQKVNPYDPSLFYVSYTDITVKQKERWQLADIIKQKTDLPFDLDKDALVRLELIRTAPRECIIMLTMHHIITDAWSTNIFVKELLKAYQLLKDGKVPRFPELKIQYKDYSKWYNTQLQSDRIIKAKEYWFNAFKEKDIPLMLPIDYSRQKRRSTEANKLCFLINSTKVLDLGERTNSTLYTILLACLKVWLRDNSGQQYITIGSPTSGRIHEDLEFQMGYFLNTLPIRTFISDEEKFTDVLYKVRQNMLDALEHQVFPFEMLIEELNPGKQRNRFPLFDIGFTWQDFKETKDIIQNGFGESVLVQNCDDLLQYHVKTDLWLHAWREEDSIKFDVFYNKNLFKEKTILEFINTYQILVSIACEKPENRINELIHEVRDLFRKGEMKIGKHLQSQNLNKFLQD